MRRSIALVLSLASGVYFAGAGCSSKSSSAPPPDNTPDAGEDGPSAADACAGDACAPPAPTCTDGAKNGAETDVDCGGATCPKCKTGSACINGSDCVTLHCEANICDVPSCSDGVKDGDETDVDCGGSCATKCAPGQGCNLPDDCRSSVCTRHACDAPSCADGVRNGAETDVDCGGTCPACALGKLCKVPGDCQSSICANKCVECIKGTDCPNRVCINTSCVVPAPQSCTGLAATCGSAGNVDCCDAPLVTGGTYARGYDRVNYLDNTNTATVADFKLDRFEVTVGRFRKFIAAYPGSMPAAESGANPSNPADTGWDPAFSQALPATQALFMTNLGQAACGGSTWTDAPGANENLPINCVTWFEAAAFCIWDQGRLPTEAEWNYAATGGADQRVFPWGPALTATNAAYTPAPIAAVGSLAAGAGKYGQLDMAGNLWEWVLDYWAAAYPKPCSNCANLTAGTTRVVRGGSVNPGDTVPNDLRANSHNAAGFPGVDPANRYFDQGVRCARK